MTYWTCRGLPRTIITPFPNNLSSLSTPQTALLLCSFSHKYLSPLPLGRQIWDLSSRLTLLQTSASHHFDFLRIRQNKPGSVNTLTCVKFLRLICCNMNKELHSLLWLNNIPLYGFTRLCLSIFLVITNNCLCISVCVEPYLFLVCLNWYSTKVYTRPLVDKSFKWPQVPPLQLCIFFQFVEEIRSFVLYSFPRSGFCWLDPLGKNNLTCSSNICSFIGWYLGVEAWSHSHLMEAGRLARLHAMACYSTNIKVPNLP